MAYDELKTAAETVRRRLHHRLWRLAEAQTWADGISLRMDRPHDWLIDVSTAKTAAHARDALLRADGEPDSRQVWAGLMGDWVALLKAQPDRDSEIARVLFDLAMADDVPAPEASGPMYAFWDGIDLAKERTYGVLEDERRKLRDFLTLWSKPQGTQDGEP